MKTLSVAATAALLIGASALSAAPAPTTKSVYPGNLEGWFFYSDVSDTVDNSLGSFVFGPGTPPLGQGGVKIQTILNQRPSLSTYQFAGTKLADITTLRFSTYNPSAGNGGSANRSGYLNFNVDFNGSDTWQRRLVYVPSANAAVTQNNWKEWDAINGGNALWLYSGATWPISGTPGTTPKTWAQILAEYPGVRIRVTDAFLGIRVGEPYPDGYTENIDAFKFATATAATTFDFEPLIGPPATKDACKQNGWQAFNYPTFKNQGDCIQFVNTGK